MNSRYRTGSEQVWVLMDLETGEPVRVFRDEFEAEDFGDEYWLDTKHDCIVKPSRLS